MEQAPVAVHRPGEPVALGEPVGPVAPGEASTLADALARLGGRPCVIEAVGDGVRVQAHVDGDAVTVFGIEDPDAVASAAREVLATRALLLGAVSADGVRFDDLLVHDDSDLASRPLADRLERLAEIAPHRLMVDRTTVAEPAWAEAFASHARARGQLGVLLRALDAGWPVSAADAVFVRF